MGEEKTTESLTQDDFAALLGMAFTLEAANAEIEATLDTVRASAIGAAPAAVNGGRRAPFSLILHGPAEPFLPQGTYRLRHPAVGAHVLFVVPVGPPPGGPELMRYQIIFS